MTLLLPNQGSTARDYLMLERNGLAHYKLALLLSLLSSSVLLRARLVPDEDNPAWTSGTTGVVVASLQFTAALAAVVAGAWEYYCGYWDLRNMHAFLVAVKPHFAIISLVAAVVFITCIIVISEH